MDTRSVQSTELPNDYAVGWWFQAADFVPDSSPLRGWRNLPPRHTMRSRSPQGISFPAPFVAGGAPDGRFLSDRSDRSSGAKPFKGQHLLPGDVTLQHLLLERIIGDPKHPWWIDGVKNMGACEHEQKCKNLKGWSSTWEVANCSTLGKIMAKCWCWSRLWYAGVASKAVVRTGLQGTQPLVDGWMLSRHADGTSIQATGMDYADYA